MPNQGEKCNGSLPSIRPSVERPALAASGITTGEAAPAGRPINPVTRDQLNLARASTACFADSTLPNWSTSFLAASR